MITYQVRHETVYSYSNPVSTSHSVAHLLPRSCETQELQKLQLRIEPTPSSVHWFHDYFGNPAIFFIVTEPHDRLRVLAESRIKIHPPTLPVDGSPPWEQTALALREAGDARTLAAYEFVFDSPFVATNEAFAAYARPSFSANRPLLDAARDLCGRIHREFRYDPEATTVATPIEEVLSGRHGVCQDFAHVMIGALRSLGLAARYVSGYIRSRPPERDDGKLAASTKNAPTRTAGPPEPRGTPEESTELVGTEASHAWVSVFCPATGWIDFDPTNDMLPSDRHIVLSWGRDYDDVSPLQGVTLGGGLQTVKVGVRMRPIDEPES